MTATLDLATTLRQSLALWEETLRVFEAEADHLRTADPMDARSGMRQRRALLPRLVAALESLRQCRSEASDGAHPGSPVRLLLQRGQQLLMRLVLLDQDNERVLRQRTSENGTSCAGSSHGGEPVGSAAPGWSGLAAVHEMRSVGDGGREGAVERAVATAEALDDTPRQTGRFVAGLYLRHRSC